MDHTLLSKMTSWMTWARMGKRPSEGDIEDETNLLLSLIYPEMTNAVLDYLDAKSLLALRLVCKQSKWWVDSQPRYLSKLRITLHSSAGSKRMRKVLRSKVDFVNFRIGCEKRNNDELLLEFGNRFSNCLRVLDINTMMHHDMMLKILSNCQALDALTLLGINLSKLGTIESDQLQGISQVLSNLKVLSIGNVLFVQESEMVYFANFIKLAKNLHSLRLPYINFQSKRPKELRDDILRKHVLTPVLDNILRRGVGGTNLKYIILEYLNPLPPDLFYRLAKVCFEFKTILHNVHESHLKERLDSEGDVQEIIGTLDGLNGNILFKKLINVKCISIWVSSAHALTERNFEDPLLPKLLNVNLYVDTIEDDSRINRLISVILGTPRPSVVSLKISYNSRKGASSAEMVRALDIAQNFQFLRKLDIYQWDVFDEEFLLLWKGLGAARIQELSLLLCTNLSDRGLLGWDAKKPAILALSGLKELHISSLYGSITDATIYRAFRHMPLQKLRLYSQSITYEGLASLLNGVFYTSVQYIHCSKPLDCTQKEFYYLVKDIMNAKNCADFARRKHLRRRSQPLVLSGPSDEDDDDS